MNADLLGLAKFRKSANICDFLKHFPPDYLHLFFLGLHQPSEMVRDVPDQVDSLVLLILIMDGTGQTVNQAYDCLM